MNQAAEAEFMGVPGSELPVRQTRREGPAMLLDRTMAAIFCRRRSGLTAMLLRLDGGGDLRQRGGFFCMAAAAYNSPSRCKRSAAVHPRVHPKKKQASDNQYRQGF